MVTTRGTGLSEGTTMDASQLAAHLVQHHGIDGDVAHEVIAGATRGHAVDDGYLRGFHDGLHGRVDADDHEDAWHPTGVGHPTRQRF